MAAIPAAPVTTGTSSGQAVTTRKRRRRAAASGAADDCFTCRRLHLTCDRRRPYCSQCLDHGKDCSGYKTQLTWGIGVASRGKLRGQTVPVAKKSSPSPTKAAAQRVRRASSSTAGSVDLVGSPSECSVDWSLPPPPPPPPPPPSSLPATAPALAETQAPSLSLLASVANYDLAALHAADGATTLASSAEPDATVRAPHFEPAMPTSPADYGVVQASSTRPASFYGQRRLPHNLLQIDTPLARRFQGFELMTASSSASGFSEGDVASPVDFSQPPEPVPYHYPPMPIYHDALLPPHRTMPGLALAMDERTPPTSYPGVYIAQHSMPPNFPSSAEHCYDFGGCQRSPTSAAGPCSLADMLFGEEDSARPASGAEYVDLGFGYDTLGHKPMPLFSLSSRLSFRFEVFWR